MMGLDQIVVIMDSGVEAGHAFFGGRVIHEACFSFAGQAEGQTFTSNCPNGSNQQFGAGAATPCTGGGCLHGTHVAGIAAGSNTSFSGVAKNAKIIAVQVTSNTAGCGGFSTPPCGTPRLSRVIAAMEWLYDLQLANPSYNIAAVNLSLGSTNVFTKACDSFIPPQTDAINLLHSIGIVTIAGTGNGQNGQGFINGISLPSCISTAVSVRSASAHPGTLDQISGFSNSVNFMDLLAPGLNINSSIPGGGYQSQSGTSMATPQVTGAWALMRDAQGNAPIVEILAALKGSGILVTDHRNSVTTPRIKVDTAITALLADTYAPLYDVVINEVRTESQQAVEIYNRGSVAANLSKWHLQILSGNGTGEKDFAFPTNYTVPSGAYRVIQRGSGSASNTLYMGTYTTSWGANGAARLTNGSVAVDFMPWGNATVLPGVGTGWTGINPPAPVSGKTIGRDNLSTDYHDATDWSTMTPTLYTVNQTSPPPNDNFANATVISSLPYSNSANTRVATKQSQENSSLLPNCAAAIGHTVWYQFTATSALTLKLTTKDSDFDTVMAVWKNVSTTPQQIACNDDIVTGSKVQSQIFLSATAGQTYYIQIGGYDIDAGYMKFELTEGGANDSRAGATLINSLPYSDDVNTEDSTASSDDPQPSCNPDPVEHSVWYRYTPAQNVTIQVTTSGSDFDTVVSIWADNGSLSEVACNDDVSFFNLSSIVQASLTANTTYYFMISGAASGYSGNLHLEITAGGLGVPNLQSPNNGAVITHIPIAFSWQSVASATSYQIQIDDQSNFGSPAKNVTQSVLTYNATGLTDGAYYWRVRALTSVTTSDWSSTRNFTLNTAPSIIPQLISPEDDASTSNTRPTFTWQAVNGISTYEIQLSRNNPPDSTPIEIQATSYQPADALLTTDYYWRVRSVANGGAKSDWSSIRSIEIEASASAAPIVNFYPDGDITLTWNIVTWATKYHIQVAINSNFSTLIYEIDNISATSTPQVSPPTLPSGAYGWRVRAQQDDGRWGNWSAISTFYIDGD